MRRLLPLLVLFACDPEVPGDTDTESPDPERREAATDGDGYFVTWSPDPAPIPVGDEFTMTVSVYVGTSDETSCTSCAVSVDATMPGHMHGMNQVPVVTAQQDGTHLVEGMLFHMPGAWRVTVTVEDGDAEETAVFDEEVQ